MAYDFVRILPHQNINHTHSYVTTDTAIRIIPNNADIISIANQQGEVVLRIRHDGSVEVTGNVDEAAQAFWDAVERLNPRRAVSNAMPVYYADRGVIDYTPVRPYVWNPPTVPAFVEDLPDED